MESSIDEGFVRRMEASMNRGNIWMCQEAGRTADIKRLQLIANSPATDAALVDRVHAVLKSIQSHMNAVSALCIGSHVGLIHECYHVPKNTTGVIVDIDDDEVILQVDTTKKQLKVKKLVLEVR